MNELLAALTRAANAVANYYEVQAGAPQPQTKPSDVQAMTAKEVVEAQPKKPRAKKGEKAVDPNADILAEAAAATPPPAKVKIGKTEMTEEQSVKAVTDIAKLLVSKYNKPVAPDNKPEGFHLAKKLLIEDFKVGRLSDLSHAQRIEFVQQVRDILTNGVPAGMEIR